jgi:hypothetical protein
MPAIGLSSEDSDGTLSRDICIYYYSPRMIATGTSGVMRKCFRLADMQATRQEAMHV